jgi:hypothetical protein
MFLRSESMKAIVFFEDGHTEKVLYHTYTKDAEEKNEYFDISFKFKTESGLYLYTEYLNIIPTLYNTNDVLPPIRYREYKFYKYNADSPPYEEEWMVTHEIVKIELYDEEEQPQ